MLDAECRRQRRFFYWLGFVPVFCALWLGSALRMAAAPQSSPATTAVQEVRAHDYGWSSSNDRNLLGRFNTQTFSLPRLARAQNYFLRLYDSSSPPKYSRYAAALHVSYPL